MIDRECITRKFQLKYLSVTSLRIELQAGIFRPVLAISLFHLDRVFSCHTIYRSTKKLRKYYHELYYVFKYLYNLQQARFVYSAFLHSA